VCSVWRAQLGTAAYSVSYARWGVELLFLANAREMHAELFKVDDMLAKLECVRNRAWCRAPVRGVSQVEGT